MQRYPGTIFLLLHGLMYGLYISHHWIKVVCDEIVVKRRVSGLRGRIYWVVTGGYLAKGYFLQWLMVPLHVLFRIRMIFFA
jgi:hypothetical protein